MWDCVQIWGVYKFNSIIELYKLNNSLRWVLENKVGDVLILDNVWPNFLKIIWIFVDKFMDLKYIVVCTIF